MKVHMLVENGGKYAGQYVAIVSAKKNKVISNGYNPTDVLNKAKKKGAKDPILVHIPKKNAICLY